MHKEIDLLTKSMLQKNSWMDDIKRDNYYVFKPIINEYNGVNCVDKNGHELLVFGSCDYLGFAQSETLKKAACDAIMSFGTNTYGAQIFSGYTAIHAEIVEYLKQMYPGKDVLLFPSGMHANLGVLSSLFGEQDCIIQDRENHVSLFHGAQLSKATQRSFAHNDLEKLIQILDESQHFSRKVIVTDGTFSSVGDLGKIDEITKIAKKYNALVFVDEAHSFGVNGAHGAGASEHYNCLEDVDIITGTFSKAIGSVGGFVAAPQAMINYIKHNAPHYTSSRGSPPGVVAASLAGVKLLHTDYGIEQRCKLWENISYLRKNLKDLDCLSKDATSPIFSIQINDPNLTLKMAKWLYNNGILVNAFIHPGVPKFKEQLRILVTSLHKQEHLDLLIEMLVKCKNIHRNSHAI